MNCVSLFVLRLYIAFQCFTLGMKYSDSTQSWAFTLLPTWSLLGLIVVLFAAVMAIVFGVMPRAPMWWLRFEDRLALWLSRRCDHT